MTAQLDTSGRVRAMPTAAHAANWYCWSDLTPFCQGYIEALFDTPVGPCELWVGKTFSDLAPATLARIIEDCERHAADPSHVGGNYAGKMFWKDRNDEAYRAAVDNRRGDLLLTFPPLAPYLADDGLIYFR